MTIDFSEELEAKITAIEIKQVGESNKIFFTCKTSSENIITSDLSRRDFRGVRRKTGVWETSKLIGYIEWSLGLKEITDDPKNLIGQQIQLRPDTVSGHYLIWIQ